MQDNWEVDESFEAVRIKDKSTGIVVEIGAMHNGTYVSVHGGMNVQLRQLNDQTTVMFSERG